MSKRTAAVLIVAAASLLVRSATVNASGPLGIYAIVEKVVFEPNEQAAERVQVWGAFAYVDGTAGESVTVSPAKRGYMYFRMPTSGDDPVTPEQLQAVRREWGDLKSVAGTSQAVGFGRWGYIGAFSDLRPDIRSNMPPYILERSHRNQQTDLRVRPSFESPAAPALYQTETGLVKLPEAGSHAAIVKQLKNALK